MSEVNAPTKAAQKTHHISLKLITNSHIWRENKDTSQTGIYLHSIQGENHI